MRLYSGLLVRLRKQSRPTALPGDEFLRAVSSGRERRPPAAAPAPADRQDDPGGLRAKLLESERRAAAADEALRQVREQQDERLEQARVALAREREARIEAERRLAEHAPAPEPQVTQPRAEAPAPPDRAPRPDAEPELTFGAAQEPAPGQAGEPEEGWPAPWLEDDKPARRGLFRRSRS